MKTFNVSSRDYGPGYREVVECVDAVNGILGKAAADGFIGDVPAAMVKHLTSKEHTPDFRVTAIRDNGEQEYLIATIELLKDIPDFNPDDYYFSLVWWQNSGFIGLGNPPSKALIAVGLVKRG